MAEFWGMHESPAKHSYAWLPRKCDYRTDAQTDAGQSDPYVPLCFAGDPKKYPCMCLLLVCIKDKLVLLLDKAGYVSQETETKVHWHLKILLSLSQQVVLYQSGASIWWTITNLPSIMAYRNYIDQSICTGTSFERAAHLGKKLCQCNTVSKSF